MDRHDDARKRSLELLMQVEQTLAAAERTEPNDLHFPAPGWRGKNSVGQMTSAEFSAWFDAGKPPLAAEPQPQSSKERRRQVKDGMAERIAAREQIRRELRREMQQRLQQQLQAFASLMGEEAGLMEARLRAQIAELQRQLEELAPPPVLRLAGGRNG